MTPSSPPSAAIRLLQRAGIDPAIIGDLTEEYSRGRSRLWFWTQALGALIAKSVQSRKRFATAREAQKSDWGRTVLVTASAVLALACLVTFSFITKYPFQLVHEVDSG
jgi:hypothetical protein